MKLPYQTKPLVWNQHGNHNDNNENQKNDTHKIDPDKSDQGIICVDIWIFMDDELKSLQYKLAK